MFATGRTALRISNEQRKLSVTVTPAAAKVGPGATTSFTIKTTDHAGNAIPSRVVVMAVDEGVLSLMNFKTPDPLSFFYAYTAPGTALEDVRAELIKVKKEKPKPPPMPRPANEGAVLSQSKRPGALMLDSVAAAPTGGLPLFIQRPIKQGVMG